VKIETGRGGGIVIRHQISAYLYRARLRACARAARHRARIALYSAHAAGAISAAWRRFSQSAAA